MPESAALDDLRARADEAAGRAYAPYSGRPEGAALLLADGRWVPGARVENASFPLTIPALLAAYVAVRGAGRAGDVRAAVATHPLRAGEAAWLAAALDAEGVALQPVGDDALAVAGALPAPLNALDLFLPGPPPAGDAEGVALAARVARRAWVPASQFPVGCVVETHDGRLVPGVNVEHDDWTRGLCAERAALATAVSLGAGPQTGGPQTSGPQTGGPPRRIWLACPLARDGSPCGACRQVLAELAPGVPVVMDRGARSPEVTSPEALLPGAFRGDRLRA